MKVKLPMTGQTDIYGNRLILIPYGDGCFERLRYPTYDWEVSESAKKNICL
jgi:hypothetical protein